MPMAGKICCIKVVPSNTPNADGEWLALPEVVIVPRGWKEASDFLDKYIPAYHELVGMSSLRPDDYSSLKVASTTKARG